MWTRRFLLKKWKSGMMVLVHLGYLSYDIDSKSVYIPNEEVREEFIRAVTTGKLYNPG